jgi:hypothetical protein
MSLTLFRTHRQPLWEVLTLQCVSSMHITQLQHLLLLAPLFVLLTIILVLRSHLAMLHRPNCLQAPITLTILPRLDLQRLIAHHLNLCHREAQIISHPQHRCSPGQLHQSLLVHMELLLNHHRVYTITNSRAINTIQRRRVARSSSITPGITAEEF